MPSLSPLLETTSPLLFKSPLRLWHLLTLDAPTITGLWAYFLARAVGVRPPLTAMLVLILGTWVVYVSDRLLDARNGADPLLLRSRHYFARHNRKPILAAGAVAAVVLAWLIIARLSSRARAADTVVFSLAMVYFAAVHGGRRNRRLAKEVVVAILVAAATAVPAWSSIPLHPPCLSPHLLLAFATLVFAAVCWMNCVAIERWEGRVASESGMGRGRRTWPILRLHTLSAVAFALVVTTILIVPKQFYPVVLSAGTSALFLFLLDQRMHGLTKMQLRIAADLALLTPVIFLELWKWPR